MLFSQPRKVGKHNKAGEITALMRLERFKAVADYVPEEDGALCLKAGMIAGVIKKSDGGELSLHSGALPYSVSLLTCRISVV